MTNFCSLHVAMSHAIVSMRSMNIHLIAESINHPGTWSDRQAAINRIAWIWKILCGQHDGVVLLMQYQQLYSEGNAALCMPCQTPRETCGGHKNIRSRMHRMK